MNYRKKLIEVALPLEEINTASAREKSIRHGHPSTLHLWWARRPLATCRAVLFSSIVDDPGEDGVPQELLDQIDALPYPTRTVKVQVSDTLANGKPITRSETIEQPMFPKEEWAKMDVAQQRRKRLFGFIDKLVQWENSNNEDVLKTANDLIMAATGGNPPPVLDPFCGGGSIPLEAQRLGLEAHGSDLNPVAVLITKAMIELPPKFANQPPVNPEGRENHLKTWRGAQGLADDVRYYGQWMREEAEKRIGHLYPKVKAYRDPNTGEYFSKDQVEVMWAEENRLLETKETLFTHPSKLVEEELTVIAWLWARTVPSPDPAAKGAHIPLVRSFVLSSKKGREVWAKPIIDKASLSLSFEISNKNVDFEGTYVPRKGATCIFTGTSLSPNYLRSQMSAGNRGQKLFAIVAEGARGRIYLPPSALHEQRADEQKPRWTISEKMPENPRWFSPPNYGLPAYGDLFTNRQLVALTTFSDLVGEARQKVIKSAKEAGLDDGTAEVFANAVSTYLAFGIDRCANTLCTIARWTPDRQQTVTVFARQAIPMTWDFPEVNPFAGAAGDIGVSIEPAVRFLNLTVSPLSGFVDQVDASKHSQKQYLFSTDPPYFDNIGYADLSDFFYVWLRRSLRDVYPQLFSTVVTPKADELIASPYRHDGSKEKATEFFENGLHRVFARLRAQCIPDYPTTIYYAFKQSETEPVDDGDIGLAETASTGWESMLQGLVDADFVINGTWPTRTELSNRMIASGTNALASCIVLVCRPRDDKAENINRRQFISQLNQELRPALEKLTQGNIAPVDLAQAVIGPGMSVFSRYASVFEADGKPMKVRSALVLINEALDRTLEEQEGWYDSQTRWAVSWFKQRAFQEGPFGDAEGFAVRYSSPIGTLVEAGIARSGSGKVKLFTRDELSADYDPAEDKRTTIWEVTQYLVRSLDQDGELGAARMMRRFREWKPEIDIDRARELAYRLYAICDQKRWTQEARGYNALVLSWSDIEAVSQSDEARWEKAAKLDGLFGQED